ncbi:MAG: flagellar basal body P-ring formation chaperone FlgA [Gammaproteobacteria bacterium]|nr:flagellar basal body P-ring formation chaperone FlgA [Gammaproteobacteria bacterium]
MFKFLRTPLPLIICCIHLPAQGAVQDLDAVQTQVKQFIAASITQKPGVRTKIEVNALDPRLRLKPCGQALAITQQNASQTGSRRTLQVSCPDKTGWTIYVPVSISQFGSVMATRSHLRRNTAVSANDIVAIDMPLDGLTSGYFMQAQDVIGMFTRRNLRSGMVLAPKHLRPPHIVRKGESVTIQAIVSGVEVKMNGTAMTDGARGEVIDIINNSSKRAIEAEVIRPGVVQVRL